VLEQLVAFPVVERDLVIGFPGGITSFENGTGAAIHLTAKGGCMCTSACVSSRAVSLLPPVSFVRSDSRPRHRQRWHNLRLDFNETKSQEPSSSIQRNAPTSFDDGGRITNDLAS